MVVAAAVSAVVRHAAAGKMRPRRLAGQGGKKRGEEGGSHSCLRLLGPVALISAIDSNKLAQMSTLQIKDTIDGMSAADRAFTRAYLKHLVRLDDPAHRQKLGTRMRQMNTGKKVSLKAVARLSRQLDQSGL